jgi:hypothetical protein
MMASKEKNEVSGHKTEIFSVRYEMGMLGTGWRQRKIKFWGINFNCYFVLSLNNSFFIKTQFDDWRNMTKE